MTHKPLYLSDLLSDLQRTLNSIVMQAGALRLDPARSVTLVENLGKLADYSRKLENEWAQAEWFHRTNSERTQLLSEMTAVSGEVLELMRTDQGEYGKLLQFRPKQKSTPGPSGPSGGDAA